MTGLSGRMSTVMKAKISKLLDRSENPEEVLEYGYQKQVELLQNVKKGVADVVTSKKRIQMQSQKLEQQIVETRLRTHADAVDFNSGLPCRADVTDVREEADGSTIAAFALREGPTGECREGGSARVRFVIRDGQIEEWRQLPTPAPQAPQGDPA